ncbi:thioredoxin-1 [Clonorchis sinensis]|uniref:Thioredoxin n=1 Tax=Clonorchis sinensis TaxID=79923 RepID=G7YR19_CLOSI|nr:thioredoxin-1 [Clonorchis sinensis]
MKEIAAKCEFDGLLEESNSHLVVVDFFATWCGPCKDIAPKFVALSGSYPGVTFAKVDVDQLPELPEEYGVTAMPTFIFFKNGKPVETVLGASIEKVEAAVKKHI